MSLSQQPVAGLAQEHQGGAEQHGGDDAHGGHRQGQGAPGGKAQFLEGAAHAGCRAVASLEAHLHQSGHQRMAAQQRPQQGQHHHPGHQVLAEADHHRKGGLVSGLLPQPLRAGQPLAEKQGGEHQRNQGRRCLGPHLDHRVGDKLHRSVGTHRQPQQAGDQGFWQTQLAQQRHPPAQHQGDQQQKAEDREGDQDVEDLHGHSSWVFQQAGLSVAGPPVQRGQNSGRAPVVVLVPHDPGHPVLWPGLRPGHGPQIERRRGGWRVLDPCVKNKSSSLTVSVPLHTQSLDGLSPGLPRPRPTPTWDSTLGSCRSAPGRHLSGGFCPVAVAVQHRHLVMIGMAHAPPPPHEGDR